MAGTKAFIFDLNGTMIDDMAWHFDVWYDLIVNQFGAQLTREQVRQHMYGKNEEVLARIFGTEKFTPEEVARISLDKEKLYQKLYKPHLALLPGLNNFLAQTHAAKIKMAIGSAAPPFNINFVIDNLPIRHYFEVIVSGSDVVKSKPHPETYLKAAQLLNIAPETCIVFEDAPMGVEAAERAGMKAIVITTMHKESEFLKYNNVLKFVENYLDLSPVALSADEVFSQPVKPG